MIYVCLGLKQIPFRSRGDTNAQVPRLDDILPREPVVTVVNIPQPVAPQNGTEQRKDSTGIISQNGGAQQRNSEITHASLSESLKSELVHKWQRRLGSKYTIIVSSTKLCQMNRKIFQALSLLFDSLDSIIRQYKNRVKNSQISQTGGQQTQRRTE